MRVFCPCLQPSNGVRCTSVCHLALYWCKSHYNSVQPIKYRGSTVHKKFSGSTLRRLARWIGEAKKKEEGKKRAKASGVGVILFEARGFIHTETWGYLLLLLLLCYNNNAQCGMGQRQRKLFEKNELISESDKK